MRSEGARAWCAAGDVAGTASARPAAIFPLTPVARVVAPERERGRFPL